MSDTGGRVISVITASWQSAARGIPYSAFGEATLDPSSTIRDASSPSARLGHALHSTPQWTPNPGRRLVQDQPRSASRATRFRIGPVDRTLWQGTIDRLGFRVLRNPQLPASSQTPCADLNSGAYPRDRGSLQLAAWHRTADLSPPDIATKPALWDARPADSGSIYLPRCRLRLTGEVKVSDRLLGPRHSARNHEIS